MYDSEQDTRKHIRKVQSLIGDVVEKLKKRAAAHDKSKLGPVEKPVFDKFTPKLKKSIYGSDEYKKYLKEMSVALDHHYKHNKHHPEYFCNGIQGMSLIDLIEMFCDWKAATLRHNDGDIIKSTGINKARFEISADLYAIFLNTIQDMGW